MLKRTSLFDWHSGNKATFTGFSGWEMPLYYEGITAEHLHTRQKASLFDLSHMGRIEVVGQGAHDFVNRLTPVRLSAAKPSDVLYSFLLREDGTAIDDITVYVDEQSCFLVVNAGNADEALAWVQAKAASEPAGSIEIRWRSDLSMIAIQGPNADMAMRALFGQTIELPKYYKFVTWHDTVSPWLMVSGTGYTGERGYELYVPSEKCQALWEALLLGSPEAEVLPAGLGARDGLRLEAGMPLFGHELTAQLTPIHANFERYIDWTKPEFIGREALKTESERPDGQRLIAFTVAQRGPIPREGSTVHLKADGPAVGTVTSGLFSPVLQRCIGMAYAPAGPSARPGEKVYLNVRGRFLEGEIVPLPFYRRKKSA